MQLNIDGRDERIKHFHVQVSMEKRRRMSGSGTTEKQDRGLNLILLNLV